MPQPQDDSSPPVGENPSDEHRDPALVRRVAAIAGRVLRRHGASPEDVRHARRARGASNLTWLAGGLAIRVGGDPGDLLREAGLAAHLSPAVGYPRVLHTGVDDGHEWLLAAEVPGTNLEDAWPSLDWDARERALLGLWQKTQAVHATSTADAAPHARSHSPFYAPTPDAAEAQLTSLESRAVLSPTRCTSLRAHLTAFWHALPLGHPVLCHGDPTVGNGIWRDGRIVCLLDLEFAVIAPIELDAHSFLRGVDSHLDEPDPVPDQDGTSRRRLLDAASAAVRPCLRHPGAAPRLRGYAVLFQLWSLNGWLTHWEPGEDYTTWRPYRHLTTLADGHAAYLAPLLTSL